MQRIQCVVLIVVFATACGVERPAGKVEGGTVRIVCGQPETPCNFHVTAPKELTRGTVSVDGACVVVLFPAHIEHPYRTLLLAIVGVEPSSETAVATFHVPAGTHVLRIVHPEWEPIERTFVRRDPREKTELTIQHSDLRKPKPL